jgi:predicted glycogen debranching enzyme
MTPPTGERLLRFVGDRVRFTFRTGDGAPLPEGWRVLLRTNLGRGRLLRNEIIHSYPRRPPLAGAAWHDVPLARHGDEWAGEITLTETGFFRAKAYAVDPDGRQHWPHGDDTGISVHADQFRTGNTIYCAFIRMFGETKRLASTADAARDETLRDLDERGYTVIPPSGKIRDLIRELPFIIDTLGCRVVHLLPVNPTPTTFAKFGRFGSPYAAQDLTAIDPALVEFDRRTTGIDQFRELTCAVHARGARVFIDIVINHTGWGARLQETHPEWYLRDEQGNFVSPGAWGNIWEDLAELDHAGPELWQELAGVFLTWCRRGVDGFRCDAGYKVPLRAWRYITARVLEEFPETVFLLEGLGGSWEATEQLLTEGAMQWAYSELFQNYSGPEIANYLDYALRQSGRLGLYVHYSETHDNDRLAKRGRAWSLLRNRVCALTSVGGGFGFTCGVEWLAAEKVNVHSSRGLSWGAEENIVPELARLNALLRDHPCFFDGAVLRRLNPPESPVFALHRVSADGTARVVAAVNTDLQNPHELVFDATLLAEGEFDPARVTDLLVSSGELASCQPHPSAAGRLVLVLPPAGTVCLSLVPGVDADLARDYRRARAQAAWAVTALSRLVPAEDIGPFDWRELAALVHRDPRAVLAAFDTMDRAVAGTDLLAAVRAAMDVNRYARVVERHAADARRIVLLPAGHWLLVRDTHPFRAVLRHGDAPGEHAQSVEIAGGHVAAFAPRNGAGDLQLEMERHGGAAGRVDGTVRTLAAGQDGPLSHERPHIALLTNGRGGMARLAVDFGAVHSKYDCLLGANLHASVPVDRHVFAKRARVWINADGFITPLNGGNLVEFRAGPAASWRFAASAGDGRAVEIDITAEMPAGANTTILTFRRPQQPPALGSDLPGTARVSLVVRVDVEDRNFHNETRHHGGSDHHFAANTRLLSAPGFEFTPAPDRQLRVVADRGRFHPQPEWCHHIAHPVEASRGQEGSGDAYSPGWFEIPLERGEAATLVTTAEREALATAATSLNLETGITAHDDFESALLRAAKDFVVRRGEGRTVIAGYPWFLDWGRDTLICVRGLIAAGWLDEVREILLTFARFEDGGTLPNTIHGENASNRDTSDAPLWFGVACEEMAVREPAFYDRVVDAAGRTVREVLRSIAVHYARGTANGIRMDAASALVWSPSHFTWMDTNHPAGTPREGYPVEIQVLWIRLLRQLARTGAAEEGLNWTELATRAEESLHTFFWFEDAGYFADVLIANAATPARNATPDNALRSNFLFAVSLGLVRGEQARRCVENAARHLVVPGALRSLAPLPVSPPLPVRGADGRLLNDPLNPYRPRYEGDEDTSRKPAYHNGTAWIWTFPVFCEALAAAWDGDGTAAAAARDYLWSARALMQGGCAGHLPEICDGDAPHQPRGCDAQAWSATEVLRVWRKLKQP